MSRKESTINIAIVDDSSLFRQGLASILASEDDLHVVGETNDRDEALELLNLEQPDIVLLGSEVSKPMAVETLRRMLRVSPDSKVVVLTARDEARSLSSLLDAGACAYMSKSTTREELLATVHTVNRKADHVVLSVSRETLKQLKEHDSPLLSTRELEVLSLVADGMRNSQIAATLHISEGTVKRHLTNIYTKLGATSRTDAVNKATGLSLPLIHSTHQAR